MTNDRGANAKAAEGKRTSRQLRVITGALAGTVAVGAVLLLPSDAFFLCCLVLFAATAAEYARLARHWAPSGSSGALPALVVAASAAGFVCMRFPDFALPPLAVALASALFVVLVPALLVLWSNIRIPEAGIALGLTSFGLACFTLAALSTYQLHAIDPWLLLALLFLVWAGDTAAYFGGSAFGRRKLAPVISPNKTWEGSAVGLVASLAVVIAWSQWRLGTVRLDLVLVGGLAAAAGQAGDLVESLFKRGAGVKDSSNILPGHGGLYDRLDALLLAAPVFLLGAAVIGLVP